MKPESLFDKKRMGGLIGAGGYDFEVSYILSELPSWLSNDKITSFQQELWSDVDIFLANDKRWLIQIKDHKLELREFKEIINDFLGRELQNPGLYEKYRIVSQGTSSTISKVQNSLNRYRNVSHLSDTELATSKEELKQSLEKYGLEEQSKFISENGDTLYIDSKTEWIRDETKLQDVFRGSLNSKFGVANWIATSLFLEWARLLTIRRGKLITLHKLREQLRQREWGNPSWKSQQSLALFKPDQPQPKHQYRLSRYGANEAASSTIPVRLEIGKSAPIPDRNFVGRDELIHKITESTKSIHFITILGMPGVGKTALMKQFISQYDSRRVFWYEFYPGLFSINNIISEIADFLFGVTGRNMGYIFQASYLSERRQLELLLEILNANECYLFFDSVQYVEDDPDFISLFTILKIQLKLGGVFIACRSRPAFVTPTDELQTHVEVIELEGLNDREAARFFELNRMTFGEETINTIQDRFSGLPIALEWIRLLYKKDDENSELLEIVDKVEEKLQHLFQQVFHQLSTREREVLRTACLFNFMFTRNQAIGFFHDILGGVDGRLYFDRLHKDLLITQSISDYHLVHELIRSFTRQYTDGLDELRLKLADYLSEKHKEDVFAQLEALLLYLETGSVNRAAQLATFIFDSATIRYFPGIAQSTLDAFSEDSVEDKQWLWLLHRKGNLAEYLRQLEEAKDYYNQMLRLAQRLGDKRAVADAFHSLGILHMNIDMAVAEQYCSNSLALYKELDDFSSVANSYNTLGSIYIELRKYDEAYSVLHNGLSLLNEIDPNSWYMGSLEANLGHLYGLQEKWEEAIEHTQKAYAIAEETGSPYDISRIIYDLGVHEAQKGNNQKALEYYRQALEIAENHGLWEIEEITQIALGRLSHKSGHYDDAIAHFRRVIEIREKVDDKSGLVLTYFDVGTFYGQKGDYDNALEYYEKGISLFEYIADEGTANEFFDYTVGLAAESPTPQRIVKALKQLKNRLCADEPSSTLAKAYGSLGEIYYRVLRKYRVAIVCFRQEIKLLKQLNRVPEWVAQLINLGTVFEELSRYAEAIKCYSEAIKIGESTNLILPVGIALYNRSNSFARIEMLDLSENDLKRALDVARDVNDDRLEEAILFNLGEIYRRQERFKEAIELISSSVQFARQEEDIDSEIDALNNLGLAYDGATSYEEAVGVYQQALELCRKHYRRSAESRILISLGNHYLENEQPQESKNYYEQALVIAREVEDIELEEGSMLSLANAHRQLGTIESIKADFEAFGNRASELGRYEPLLQFTLIAAEANLDEGEVGESIDMFEYALMVAIFLGYERIRQFLSLEEKPQLMPEFTGVIEHFRYSIYEAMQRGAVDDAKLLHSGILNRLRSKEEWWIDDPVLDVFEAIGDDFERFSIQPS